MLVTIENHLEVTVYIATVEHRADYVEFVIGNVQPVINGGAVLRQDTLLPGEALSLRGLPDDARFEVAGYELGGHVIRSTLAEGRNSSGLYARWKLLKLDREDGTPTDGSHLN